MTPVFTRGIKQRLPERFAVVNVPHGLRVVGTTGPQRRIVVVVIVVGLVIRHEGRHRRRRTWRRNDPRLLHPTSNVFCSNEERDPVK